VRHTIATDDGIVSFSAFEIDLEHLVEKRFTGCSLMSILVLSLSDHEQVWEKAGCADRLENW
jgi:hypothetical protein